MTVYYYLYKLGSPDLATQLRKFRKFFSRSATATEWEHMFGTYGTSSMNIGTFKYYYDKNGIYPIQAILT